MKLLYIILDGLGDRPIKKLGNKTPLQKANTFYLDKLAREGKTGIFYPLGEKIAPESDTAVFSLLGYDLKDYPGRGVIESIGAGLPFKNGDLALRANFALCKGRKIIDRRVGRKLTTEQGEKLAREINKKIRLKNFSFVFKSTIGHRGVLLIKGPGLSGFITNSDPAYKKKDSQSIALKSFKNEIQKVVPLPNFKNEQTERSARLVNEWSERTWKFLQKNRCQATCILLRDAGSNLSPIPSIYEKTGLSWGAFVSMPVEKGICKILKMKIIKVPLYKNLQKTYIKWAETALKEIKKLDALYIHIKGPDEPGHDGDFQRKKEIIELIDKHFFSNLIPKIKKRNYVVCVTADHSTPCVLKAHSSDPVPLLIWGDDIKNDLVNKFSEKDCKKGKLKIIRGKKLIKKLINIDNQ